MANADCLPCYVIQEFLPLAEYYNSKSRIEEEEADWFGAEANGFIIPIDLSYHKILKRRLAKMRKDSQSPSPSPKRNGRNQSKNAVSALEINFAAKLEALRELTVKLHCANSRDCDIRSITINEVDSCILYFSRGKLRELPSRIHLQMIMFGYTPHQKRIIALSKSIEDKMKCIESIDKMKEIRKNRADEHRNHSPNQSINNTSKLQKLKTRQKAYAVKHGDKSGKLMNSGFVESGNLQWTPPMTMDVLFYRLSLCADRTKHTLSYETSFDEIAMVYQKSKECLFNDAMNIIGNKIKVKPKNDWYQTPYHGHPVYIAMHATATCCRICLGQWFNISEKGTLTITQMKYIASVLLKWIELNCPPQFA